MKKVLIIGSIILIIILLILGYFIFIKEKFVSFSESEEKGGEVFNYLLYEEIKNACLENTKFLGRIEDSSYGKYVVNLLKTFTNIFFPKCWERV